MAVTSLTCTCCTRLRALTAASAPGRKPSISFPTPALHALVVWLVLCSPVLPGTRVHIDFCDTLWSLQLVFGHVVAGHCPLHCCRILKVNFATGATGHCHQMQRH